MVLLISKTTSSTATGKPKHNEKTISRQPQRFFVRQAQTRSTYFFCSRSDTWLSCPSPLFFRIAPPPGRISHRIKYKRSRVVIHSLREAYLMRTWRVKESKHVTIERSRMSIKAQQFKKNTSVTSFNNKQLVGRTSVMLMFYEYSLSMVGLVVPCYALFTVCVLLSSIIAVSTLLRLSPIWPSCPWSGFFFRVLPQIRYIFSPKIGYVLKNGTGIKQTLPALLLARFDKAKVF